MLRTISRILKTNVWGITQNPTDDGRLIAQRKSREAGERRLGLLAARRHLLTLLQPNMGQFQVSPAFINASSVVHPLKALIRHRTTVFRGHVSHAKLAHSRMYIELSCGPAVP